MPPGRGALSSAKMLPPSTPSPAFANRCKVRTGPDHFVVEFEYMPPCGDSATPVAQVALPLATGFDVALDIFKAAFTLGPQLTEVFARFQAELNKLNELRGGTNGGRE